MSRERELWRFVSSRLDGGEYVVLLVVAESSGSSPGRSGYKMVVGSAGELCGSIGGGVMEVNLVEKGREILRATSSRGSLTTHKPTLIEQDHKRNTPDASGMICSGRQTVILLVLRPEDVKSVTGIVKAYETGTASVAIITSMGLGVEPGEGESLDFYFEKRDDSDFIYKEGLVLKNNLYIVGGGHCALALSELMSRLDFRISIFDDRPDLNTIEKNRFADEIRIIDEYEKIDEVVGDGPNAYVVVMTLGYKSDETVIRRLVDRNFKYFGVLGSRAKMKTLLTTLEKEGRSRDWLAAISTPIGLAINSRTPEEIAVSIAAEIIAVKNGRVGRQRIRP